MAEKPPMPQQPTTKQIPRVEVPSNTLEAVLVEVRAMRSETANQFVDIFTRLDGVETRLSNVEDGKAKHSAGVRQLSSSEAKQDAVIGSLVARVDVLDGKADVLDGKVDGLSSALKENSEWTKQLVDAAVNAGAGFIKQHPQLVQALIGLLMAAAGYATAWFGRH